MDEIVRRLEGDAVEDSTLTDGNFTNGINRKVASLTESRLFKNRIDNFSFEEEEPATIFIMQNMRERRVEVKFTEAYNNFILTNVSEQHQEKFQIFETFGESSIFFFDEKTKMYSFSGYLIDSIHQKRGAPKTSWAIEFKQLWDNKLRGTKLAENNQLAVISWKRNLAWGYPIALNINTDVNAPFIAAFSFNMIIKKHKFEDLKIRHLSILDAMTEEQRSEWEFKYNKLTAYEDEIAAVQKEYEETIVEEDRAKKLEEIAVIQKFAADLYIELLRKLTLLTATRY